MTTVSAGQTLTIAAGQTSTGVVVLSGGGLSAPAWVPEQYLLDLEREAFMSLVGEEKTKERISHMLMNGKPLRN